MKNMAYSLMRTYTSMDKDGLVEDDYSNSNDVVDGYERQKNDKSGKR